MSFKYLIFYLALLSNVVLFGQMPADLSAMKNIDGFKSGLKSMTENTSTIQSDFVQNKKLKVMRMPIVSEGIILFKKPQFLKWAYTTPYKYSIVLNGEEIIIDDAGKVNQISLSESQLFADLSNIIIQSVEGSILEDDRFDKEYLENDSYNAVSLVPRDTEMQAYLQKMTLFFDKQTFAVQKIIMDESEGNFTELLFSNTALNQPIDDNAFKAH